MNLNGTLMTCMMGLKQIYKSIPYYYYTNIDREILFFQDHIKAISIVFTEL